MQQLLLDEQIHILNWLKNKLIKLFRQKELTELSRLVAEDIHNSNFWKGSREHGFENIL